MGHSHAEALESPTTAVELIQHIQISHGGEFWAGVGSDWHWHWVMRGTAYAGLHAEFQVAEVASTQAVKTNLLSDLQLPGVEAGLLDGAPSASRCAKLSGANFLRSQSETLQSFPTRLSVMRC